MQRTKKQIKRVGTAIVGGGVLIVGIIAIPYPGPGWLIVFTGLAILSTEFDWAKRVLDFARHKYDAWTQWLIGQPLIVRVVVFCFTGLVVLITMWLLNVFGVLSSFLRLDMPWLQSPLGIFK